MGKDVRCVAFVGDGCATDVGFQPLSGAAERNENIIFMCYDNEGYMNTGIQRSSTTPFGGWTTTTPAMGGERARNVLQERAPDHGGPRHCLRGHGGHRLIPRIS